MGVQHARLVDDEEDVGRTRADPVVKGLRVDDGRGWVVRVDEVDDDGAVDARDGLLHGLKVDGPLRAHRHGDDLDVVLAGRVGAVAVGEFGTDEADAGTDVGLDARADRFGGAVREHHVLGLAAHEVGAGLAEPFGCDERVAVGVGQGCDRGVAGGGREAERIFVEAERHRLFAFKEDFSKNTFYRFINSTKTNWLRFTSLLAADIVDHDIKNLTNDSRKNVFIMIFIDQPTNDLDYKLVNILKDLFCQLKKNVSCIVNTAIIGGRAY